MYYIEIGRLPVQTAQGAWLGFGIQPNTEAHGDLRV